MYFPSREAELVGCATVWHNWWLGVILLGDRTMVFVHAHLNSNVLYLSWIPSGVGSFSIYTTQDPLTYTVIVRDLDLHISDPDIAGRVRLAFFDVIEEVLARKAAVLKKGVQS